MEAPEAVSTLAPEAPISRSGRSDTSSPFVTMWLHPGRAMRQISHIGAELWGIPIAMLGSAGSVLIGIDPRHAALADAVGLSGIPAGLFVAGLTALGAAIGVVIYGWLVAATGSWLGGRAESLETRAAVGWSYLPLLLTVPFGAAILLLHGPVTLDLNSAPIEGEGSVLLALGSMVQLVAGVWALILTIGSVREVQGFRTGRTIANLVLASIAAFVVVLLPFLLLSLLGVGLGLLLGG
jgi:hypothetical protein